MILQAGDDRLMQHAMVTYDFKSPPLVAPNDIVHDFRPFFVITKDRQVISRGEGEHVLPVSSEDIKIVSDTGISARLYIPTAAISGSIQKLPILIYYHGGGFCFGTPSAAFMTATQSFSGAETWLSNHSDFDKITIAGDSVGDNIVHNMVMRIGKEELGFGVTVRGAILVHPFFTGLEPIGNEELNLDLKVVVDSVWKFSYPTTVRLDDPPRQPVCGRGAELVQAGGHPGVGVCGGGGHIGSSRAALL
ncbi:hypothetical protein MRB53_015324 [Persea americana]|uniref:Uncharacterized protein n=1 Tax=Persea americana TaxID=3435 RepID=A0ACC2KDZ1_PERAE|nr:hypothetical protein MRB53_015324 [Persea americana]